MSEAELMSHAMTIDEVRQDMHAWLHDFARKQATRPTMTYEELEQCIPLDVAFNRLRVHIHEQFQLKTQA